MRVKSGSGLVDYIIPTAVIGIVVGIGVLSLSGNNMLLNFLTHSGNAKFINSKLTMSSQGVPDAVNKDLVLAPQKNNSSSNDSSYWNNSTGKQTGSPETPVANCDASFCSIDFGSVVIKGVPANFNEFIETSGASGGTEKLIALIDQLIEQTQAIDSSMDYLMLKELSNLGHSLATSQKDSENLAVAIGGDSVADTLEEKLNNLRDNQAISNSLNQQIQDKLNQINNIYSNSSSPTQSNLLNIVNALTKEISSYNTEYSGKIMTLVNDGSFQVSNQRDVQSKMGGTGGIITDPQLIQEGSQSILHPRFSHNTNLRSTIICSTGHHKDSGENCN